MRDKLFTFSFSSNLNLWPLDLKFAELVTLVQCYATKLEVSMSFYRNGYFASRKLEARDGQTDGVQRLMQPGMEGRVIKYILTGSF